ncbi:MAG: type VI secretion system membrane subunit TssM [Paracoccaceae bacterium]
MKWLKLALIVLGLVAWSVLMWFAGPLIGFGEARPFDPVWVRLLLIGVVVLTVGLWYLVKWLLRRRAQAAMEKALVADTGPIGDGGELANRMARALATLKRTGNSKTYLYDLPWYVIIGPPGSGKTTALVNSDIKFPLAGDQQGGLKGFGGTRYCDWWFAEEAILIDTAGRYTTQDSDKTADSASWQSFLGLLKRNRPKQPINGVILAFSIADLMRQEPEVVQAHAETVRARLAEIHETLKVDFPVYVMFTKADLISGFREYFASFSASRRKKVWGATFQTTSRKDQTFDRVAGEYDLLVARLSDEVIDRLSEEPDGVNRIAIFGLPGQMALLKDTITDFLRQVFEPTRYKTNAILRGFYFTSGTQEGTPVDQILGAMGRSFGGDAAGLMSGKGKSFFLHDLMTKVIFGEQGWVSYDRKAVRRSSVLRMAAMVAMALVSVGLLAGWGYSYLNNRQLVASAQAAMSDYEMAAADDLAANSIKDTDFLRVGNELQMLRTMPAGYAAPDEEDGWAEGFGLSQRGQLAQAARDSYADGLERLFRPRLVLRVEEQLQNFVRANEPLPIYETLKVYKALGGLAPSPQDELVRAWFRQDWADVLYPGINQQPARDMLEAHLAALLDLDGTRTPQVVLNKDLIEKAEVILARMSVADQAYSLIVATAPFSGIPDFNLVENTGKDSRLVFETVDGSDLGALSVPALFTYQGFHEFFLDQLAEVARKLESEQWVMGEQAQAANVGEQLDRLGPQLLARYREDYLAAWEGMLENLRLAPLAADKPAYVALGAAAASNTSPILKLVESVARETRLTQPPPDLGMGNTDASEALGNASPALGKAVSRVEDMVVNRTNGLKRIGLDLVLEAGKSQRRAGNAGGAAPLVPGADIEAQFTEYQALLEGEPGNRPIDALLKSLGGIQQGLIIAAGFDQAQAAAQMPALIGQLRTTASRLPPDLARMMGEAIEDFEGDAASTTIAQINEELTQQVAATCSGIVDGRYPFSGNPSRQVPLSEFAQLFGPDGVLDRFFNAHLAAHANMAGKDWTWREDSPLADRLSLQTLRQFERAAKIRDAFFPGRSPTVKLEVTISQTAAHDRIRQAVLVVDDQPIQTRQVGNTPATITWPGGGGNTSLQLLPELNNRESMIRYQGPWAFMQFLRDGSPRQLGDVLQVTYVIGGRNITYEVRVNALDNPFNMSELREFRCPTGL